LRTVRRAYAFAWNNRAALAIPAAIVFALTLAGDYVTEIWRTGRAGTPSVLSAVFWQIQALGFVITVVAAAAAVGVHRFILLGEFRPNVHFLRWDRNLGRYVVTVLLIWLAITVLSGIGGLVVGILALVASRSGPGWWVVAAVAGFAIAAFAAWFLAHMGLALPGAAIHVKDHVGLSFRATRDQAWRIVALYLVAFAPLLLISVLYGVREFVRMRTGGDAVAPLWSWVLVLAAARAVYVVVGAALLSYTFETLAPGERQRAQPA
jgi:hypothetical protein